MMRDCHLVFPLLAVALVFSMFAMIAAGSGCDVDEHGNVYDWWGCYICNLADLVGPYGAHLILQYLTVHLGPSSTDTIQTAQADPGADDYCSFYASGVDGPAGSPLSLFMEGSYNIDGNNVTAHLEPGVLATAAPRQIAGDEIDLDLERSGDNLSGDIDVTLNGVTYTGTLSVTKPED